MSNRFTITINNYTPEEVSQIRILDPLNVLFAIFAFEKAPTTNTPHLHGYLHTKSKYESNKKLIKRFPFLSRAHIIISKGSDLDNYKYCTKDGHILIQIGEPARQGKRQDLDNIKAEMLNNNKRVREIMPFINNYQSLKFAEALQKYQKPKFTYKKKKIIWLYGETGTGKTRYAIEHAGEDFWISSRNLKWWDGYTGQPVAIIDDFRGDFCTFHELLRILDGYPFRAEVKGSSLWLDAETIYITSPYSPDQVYDTIEDKTQLLRRITKIKHIEKGKTQTFKKK